MKALTETVVPSQHSGGAANISPDSGMNAYNDDGDEWDNYEAVPPPPPPPAPPAHPVANSGGGQFQVSPKQHYTNDPAEVRARKC